MHYRVLGLVTVLLPLVAACEPATPPPPSIEGLSAEDAAEITTESACTYIDRCGLIEVSCADCAEGQSCGGCFVERAEITYDACTEDLAQDLKTGFACEPLTAEEEALVDECIAALDRVECPSVAEVEAWVNGGGGSDPREQTAACDLVEEIRSRCHESDVPTPAPASPAPEPDQ